MRANECVTEVERRPSAEHAGCGATGLADARRLERRQWRGATDSDSYGARTGIHRHARGECTLWCCCTEAWHASRVAGLRPQQHNGRGSAGSVGGRARAGGAVCNSDCDGSVWLSAAGGAGGGERANGRHGFLPEDAGAGQWAGGGARQDAARSISACRFCAGADAPAQQASRRRALAAAGAVGTEAEAGHGALTSRLSAFAQASPTALDWLHRVGPGWRCVADLCARLPRAC